MLPAQRNDRRRRHTYAYAYWHGNGKLHTELHIHIGDRNVVPGTTDTGNHCDDCVTVISLPFSVTLMIRPSQCYGGVQRHLAFGTNNNAFAGSCLPVPTATYQMIPSTATSAPIQ